jgi:hypothetical protein
MAGGRLGLTAWRPGARACMQRPITWACVKGSGRRQGINDACVSVRAYVLPAPGPVVGHNSHFFIVAARAFSVASAFAWTNDHPMAAVWAQLDPIDCQLTRHLIHASSP